MEKRKKTFILTSTIGMFLILVGVTYAFFNYTRTGTSNTIRVGRISFNSNQTNTITLLDVFPIDKTDVDTSTSVGTSTITITGDTTYDDGVEYQLTVAGLTNTILPIDVKITASGIGESDTDYFDNRGGTDSIYKVTTNGTIRDNKQLLVGYIAKGSTGVNGTITIKAYLDKDKIAITDTYDGTESDNMGTTTDWANGRTIFTTTEWNELQANGVSFQVKVEANEGIWVEEQLTGSQQLSRAILAKKADTNVSCDNITYTDSEDGVVYLSGDNTCIDMNYVWYSGKLWRITAIYPDGTMKLITQNNITSLAFNESGQVNFYTDANTKSYMYQWLNEDFYDTLYNANKFIDSSKLWNATKTNTTSVSEKPAENNMVRANVGLLNNYEFYNSYRNTGSYSNGYLNINYSEWLLNPYNTSLVWWYGDSLELSGNYTDYGYGVRPTIYLKSELEFTGDGTVSSPYRIIGDKEVGAENELVNTRLSGEYVKLKNGNNEQLFRIIGVEDNKTKIIAMDYAENGNTRGLSTDYSNLWGSGNTTGNGTWYTYLNDPNTGYLADLKEKYGELFDSGLYYLGASAANYKTVVCANNTNDSIKDCAKTTAKGTFNIGLSRYGEMFATQQSGGSNNSITLWLINRSTRAGNSPFVSSAIRINECDPKTKNAARPTLHLKSTVKILSGTGTESDPYVVGL